MREMDFSEKNLANRWLGVKGMWDLLQGSNCLKLNVTEG